MTSVSQLGSTLEPLQTLIERLPVQRKEPRYGDALRVLSTLVSEITQLVAMLQVQISDDLDFLVTEKAALISERSSLYTVPESDDASQATSDAKATSDASLPAYTPSPDELSTNQPAIPATNSTVPASIEASVQQTEHMKTAPELLAQETVWIQPKVASNSSSEGRLPGWLGGNWNSRPASPPPRPQYQAPTTSTLTNDEQLRRAWLVSRGEQAHRFMMGNQQSISTSQFGQILDGWSSAPAGPGPREGSDRTLGGKSDGKGQPGNADASVSPTEETAAAAPNSSDSS